MGVPANSMAEANPMAEAPCKDSTEGTQMGNSTELTDITIATPPGQLLTGPGVATSEEGYAGLMNTSQEFQIVQTRKGCWQECCGCDANSQFKFVVNGEHTAMIEEHSSCCMRFCCGGNRSWETKMVIGQSDNIENIPGILNFSRPFACRLGPCKCCCFQEVTTTDANGLLLGGIKEQFWCCVPKFTIFGPKEEPMYDLHQPTCCCGQCVNCCAEGCCNCRIPFYLYPPEGDDNSNLIATGATCAEGVDPPAKAQICKIWSGFTSELFTDADTFEVKCPDDADHVKKAVLIGTTLMINQVFFEGNRHGGDG